MRYFVTFIQKKATFGFIVLVLGGMWLPNSAYSESLNQGPKKCQECHKAEFTVSGLP